jgi:hypothetical protein
VAVMAVMAATHPCHGTRVGRERVVHEGVEPGNFNRPGDLSREGEGKHDGLGTGGDAGGGGHGGISLLLMKTVGAVMVSLGWMVGDCFQYTERCPSRHAIVHGICVLVNRKVTPRVGVCSSSPHFEAGVHICGSCEGCDNTGYPFGGGTTVQSHVMNAVSCLPKATKPLL